MEESVGDADEELDSMFGLGSATLGSSARAGAGRAGFTRFRSSVAQAGISATSQVISPHACPPEWEC